MNCSASAASLTAPASGQASLRDKYSSLLLCYNRAHTHRHGHRHRYRHPDPTVSKKISVQSEIFVLTCNFGPKMSYFLDIFVKTNDRITKSKLDIILNSQNLLRKCIEVYEELLAGGKPKCTCTVVFQ